MSATKNFKVASHASTISSWIFRVMTLVSLVILFWPIGLVELICSPILVIGAFGGVACTFVVNIYQTQGNRLLRRAQLSNAFNSSVREAIRDTYYNSPLEPSLPRLASTTFENSLFSQVVVGEMLKKERQAVLVYFVIFFFLIVSRTSSLGLVVYIASVVFSGDVILNWLRIERFRHRINIVHEQLEQIFLQGNINTLNSTALILAAFADYECAKDEASLPLDSNIFDKINASTSEKWGQIKINLGINSSMN